MRLRPRFIRFHRALERGLGHEPTSQLSLDLSAQIRLLAEPPTLPAGWDLQVATRSVGGESFSGDLLIPVLNDHGRRLHVFLMDVSGKGELVGARSILLAGAVSALIDSVPASQVLPTMNRYLLRQSWDEGFATAVYLQVHLLTGEFILFNGGHPAPAHWRAGSGRWELLPISGPLLGVFSQADWPGCTRQLAPGDALLLYTDGLVERPGSDVLMGTDYILGHAEHLVLTGFAGAADRLLGVARGLDRDDCAVAVLHRPLVTLPSGAVSLQNAPSATRGSGPAMH